jgi:uncharacterized RDD family membrane protein YckC
MTDQNPTSPDQGSGEGYQPPATPGGYQPPATPGGYQPPAAPGGYQAPATGGYQPPAGGYQPPAGGYQPPAGGYPEPSGAPGQFPPAGGYSQPPAPGYPVSTPAPLTGPGGARLAEWPIRALGGLIDYVAAGFVVGVVGSVLSNINYTLGTLVEVVLGVGWWIYLGYLSGTYGITPGRAIAKTKLISEETGGLIGFGPAVIRQLAHFVDTIICYVGWLFPLWDSKKQTIADKIAKTVVVDNSADPDAGKIRWS